MENENDLDKKIGVYSIITPTGKVYVGMTCDSFQNRWATHKKTLRYQTHKCPGLQHAYNKYGWENLQILILQHWDKPSTKNDQSSLAEEVLAAERTWWQVYSDSGAVMLHGCPSGNGSVFHTEEVRAKIKTARALQLQNLVFSEEEKRAILVQITECSSWKDVKRKTGLTRRMLLTRGFSVEECNQFHFLAKTIWPTRETLYELYIVQKMGVMAISEKLNIVHPKISQLLKEYEIPIRTRKESSRLAAEQRKLSQKSI